jgi:hypothetical protein
MIVAVLMIIVLGGKGGEDVADGEAEPDRAVVEPDRP